MRGGADIRMAGRWHAVREWQKWVLVVIELAIIAAVVWMIVIFLQEAGIAEEPWEFDAWVMCGEDSWVIVREKPAKSAAEIGRIYCGDRFRTDQKEKNGYIHIVDANTESGEGWIHAGYVVWQEPEKVDREMVVRGGRVACRKWIGGKRRSWAAEGSRVTVYRMTAEWAVTDRGFIASEWLEDGE